MTYLQWLKSASQSLTDSDSPKRDAEILLSFVTHKTRTFLMAFSETLLSDEELIALDGYLKRRQVGEPIAYITGEK